MNLVGYIRVSTRDQVEGLGLEVQEAAIAAWCEANGHTLMAVFRDEGVSGAKEVIDRPGLGAALAAVEDQAEALVVYRLDRLARDLILQETVIASLGRLGRSMLSTQEDVEGDDPTRVLIRQVLGAISQYERALITFRMASGRAAKHARGRYAYGAPRFGFVARDHELASDTDEQETIAQIVELHEQGCSLREIASALDAAGRRPKRGSRWHPSVVSRIVQRMNAVAE